MNQNITKYLSNESLADLNSSDGYIMLIKKPKMVEQLKRSKLQAESSLIPAEKELKERKEQLENINSGNIFKRGFNALFKGKELAEKRAEIQKIIDTLQAEVDRISATVAKHDEAISALQEEIDEFILKLKAEGLVSEEVVATYHAIKEELEEQERIASEERTKRYAEEQARREEEAAILAPIGNQNKKGVRLSAREKFERRQKIANIKSANNTSTGNQPQ